MKQHILKTSKKMTLTRYGTGASRKSIIVPGKTWKARLIYC